MKQETTQRKKLKELEAQRDKLRDELYNAVIASLMELFKEDEDEDDDD